MTVDRGVAPNPYHGFCTLALCKPNHRNLHLEIGDWIVGFAGVEFNIANQQGLIYAMKITEKLSLDEYYQDSRFAAKKPQKSNKDSDWPVQCGDNMYYWDTTEKRYLQDSQAIYHTEPDQKQKDIKGATRSSRDENNRRNVFISDYFWYFGKEAVEIPGKLTDITVTGISIKYLPSEEDRKRKRGNKPTEEEQLRDEFIQWLEQTYQKRGILGEPYDKDEWKWL